MIPQLSSFPEFQQHLRVLDHERGRVFSLGVELGFGEYENPSNALRRKLTLGHNNQIAPYDNTRLIAGIEYGELLASQAQPAFLQEMQAKYPPVVK